MEEKSNRKNLGRIEVSDKKNLRETVRGMKGGGGMGWCLFRKGNLARCRVNKRGFNSGQDQCTTSYL